MSAATTQLGIQLATNEQDKLIVVLLPLIAVVFIAFFVIGMAMPVLPVHVHDHLGLGAFFVGLVSGSQFTASFLSRFWAGHYADGKGAKRAVVVGLSIFIVSGMIYVMSLQFVSAPTLSVTTLILGRGLLGAAESCIMTGALSWGLALAGPNNAGKVISWLGMPLYAGFALGAPLGSVVYAHYGFMGVALATSFSPLVALVLIARLRGVLPTTHARASLWRVAHAVGLPGVGLAFSSVGFGAVTIFIALVFAERGWNMAWLAFTSFSVAFIFARSVLGHLPDKIGGAKIALVSVLIEAAGLALIWLAPSSHLVFVGATLTGLGYALVYPGFGVEAVRRAPPESRGLVMGVYTACLDLALGIAGPGLGLVATSAGTGAIFFASMLIVLGAAVVALVMMNAQRTAHCEQQRTPLVQLNQHCVFDLKIFKCNIRSIQ